MSNKHRQSLSSGGRGELSRVKDRKESPPAPDSTTEPAPRPAQKFQEGDEVFFQTDSGQQMLGTVAEVRGETCLVQFGDGTEQRAQFKRLRKLFEDEEDVEIVQCKRKKPESTPRAKQPQPRPQQTCTSCGVSRRITAKKAKLYENTSNKFECRLCTKNNQTSKKGRLESLSPVSTGLKNKSSSDISILSIGSPPSGFSLPSHVSPKSLVKAGSLKYKPTVAISRPIQFSVISSKKHFCFSCEQLVQSFDSVGCNFCDRPCHLSCLHLTPTPLNGDTFWHLVCSTCGNQKSEKVEMKFSVRRSISSWGDIAYLLISCLSVVHTHRMFDFEKEMLPFMERHLESLHLPRQYKTQSAEAQTKFILTALSGSPRRFQNGKDFRLKTTLWGIRDSTEFPMKDNISPTAPQVGLKQSVKSEKSISKIGNVPPTTLLQPAPEFLRLVVTTPKNNDMCSSPVPTLKDDDSISDITSRSDTTESSLERERDWATTEETRSDISITPKTSAVIGGNRTSSSSSTVSSVSGASVGSASTISSVGSNRQIKSKDEKRIIMRPRAGTLDAAEAKGASAKCKARAVERIFRKRKYSEGSNSPLNKSSAGSPKAEKFQPSLKRLKAEALAISSPARQPWSPSKSLLKNNSSIPPRIMPLARELSSLMSPRPLARESSPHQRQLAMKHGTPSHYEVTPDEDDSSEPDYTQVAMKHGTPPFELSPDEDDNLPLETLKLRISIPSGLKEPFAIKSAHCTPLSPQQVQEIIDERKKPRKEKSRAPKKPKISSEAGDSNGPTLPKRGPGRPKGSSSSVSPASGIKPIESSNAAAVNRTLRQSKPSAGKPAVSNNELTFSRRVGTFNSISERRPEPPPAKQDSSALNLLNESFVEAALFGDYRIQCLPPSPITEVERRNETLKVFSHFRNEKETQMASSLLSRSEVETRSLTRRKSELFVGSQKHDLNDFDSYEVLGKRVDADGITRYQVLWKRQDEYSSEDEDQEDEEMDTGKPIETRPFAALNLFSSVAKIVDPDPENMEKFWTAVQNCPFVSGESNCS